MDYITAQIRERADEIRKMVTDGSFTVGVPVSDRDFWDKTSGGVEKSDIIARAEQYIAEPFPEITEEIYFEHKHKTKNPQSDKILFTSMRRLEQTVLAECVENKGRFLDYITDGIESILRRKSWVRAGHDSAFDYCDYNGQHGLVDLYSSSMAWRLAVCDACLGDKLSADLRARLAAKVREKVIDVYFKRLTEDPKTTRFNNVVPLYWLDAFDNWLCVCLGGVTCAGLYYCNDDERALLIALYEKYIRNYLHSLPEGDCVEGLSYWGYGFGKFICAADTIYRATNGGVDLYADKDFLLAAQFGNRISIADGVYPTVSDCDIKTEPLGFCMKYLSLRAGLDYDYEYEDAGQDIYIPLMMSNWDERLTNTIPLTNKEDKLRTWFDKRGILISRNETKDFGVYIQAGNNHIPHGHQDIGSFIIGANGETFVQDPGLSKYGGITFSRERFTLGVLSSYGHSVPKVCGEHQGPKYFEAVNTNADGKRSDGAYDEVRFVGEVLEKSFTDDADSIVLDLTKAYDVPCLESLIRKMVFDRKRCEITVTDTFSYTEENSFETAIITLKSFDIDGGRIVLNGDNTRLAVTFEGADGVLNIDSVSDGYTDDKSVPIYPMRIAKRVRAKSGSITMKFKIEK
ncbi:MAG: heparinase II/III family protein [Clostridia bacterium]|nr:heparinase II/III family protein [Clostridia bacterium]